MPNHSDDLDHVFRALSDPTRRAVVQRLSEGPASVSQLAEPFEMALPSFLQHLRVLEDSGLVQSKKSGRVRTFEISPKPLADAESWLGHQRAIWEGRLDRIEKLIAKMKAAEDKNG